MVRPKTVRFGRVLDSSKKASARWNPSNWVRIKEAEEPSRVPIWLRNKKTGDIISLVKFAETDWGTQYNIRYSDSKGRRVEIPTVGIPPEQLSKEKIISSVEQGYSLLY